MVHTKIGKLNDIIHEAYMKDAEWIPRTSELDMFIKYILCIETFIFYPDLPKQLSMHKHITQNVLFMYFNLFYICYLHERIASVCCMLISILYICAYLNPIYSIANNDMRYIFFNIQISINFCHLIVLWEAHSVCCQSFFHSELLQIASWKILFFSALPFDFPLGQLKCLESVVQNRAVWCCLLESMQLILQKDQLKL